ncbi:uncharacterized protein LOC122059836 [Macadamia integrifolia]|uniref:uncharacterized protein LOC122059836 n=1 Tax=Macadamia integrifolia TaxID=60698 RepID=UPI001C533541|nr:uncharacterized protein LOC122059836 [Macadamia integrifolia]
MPCYVSSVTSLSSRFCRKAWSCCKLLNFSVSCSVETIEFPDERTSHDNNGEIPVQNPCLYYVMLQRGMQNYAASSFYKEALHTLNLMTHITGKPTVYDYNSFMYHYLKSRKASMQNLVEVYDLMRGFGPPPNAFTYNTLLNGLLSLFSLGALQYAFYFTEEMYRNGFVPSFSLLSRLLKNSVKLGDLMGYAQNIYNILILPCYTGRE